MEEERDPFASLIRFCQPTSSQEAKLRRCFRPENYPILDLNLYPDELPSSPDPTPSEATEIVMVSPPASSTSSHQQSEEEGMVFHTPPEHRRHSQLSSSEDELRAKAARDYNVEEDRLSRSNEKARVRVSARESDNEADSKKTRVSIEEFDGETAPVGETEEIVSETQVVHNAAADDEFTIIVEDSEESDEKLDKLNLEKGSLGLINLGQKELMKGNGGIIPQVGKTCENSSCSTGSSNSKGIAASGNGGWSEMREEEKYVVKFITDHKDDDDGKRIGDVQKKRKCSRRMRKLLPPLDGKCKNVVDETVEESKEGGLSLDFVGVIEKVVGDNVDGACEDEDVDFLETAKRRGLTFPRARWW